MGRRVQCHVTRFQLLMYVGYTRNYCGFEKYQSGISQNYVFTLMNTQPQSIEFRPCDCMSLCAPPIGWKDR